MERAGRRCSVRRVGRLLVSALAGLLAWLAFPDVGIWPTLLVALALMFGVVDSVSAWAAACYGLVFGAVFWFPHVHWAQISANGGSLPWIALASSQALMWGIWAMSASLILRLHWAKSLLGYTVLASVSWVGVEQIRMRFPFSGFPWGNFAYPHVEAPLGHLAPFGGETLVSLVLACVAALLRLSVSRRYISSFENHAWARIACLVFAFVAYLAPVVLTPSAAQEAGAIRISAIQGFIEPPGAQTYRMEGKVTANHVSVMNDYLKTGQDVDLIVWGEGSLDRDPAKSELVAKLVEDVTDRAQIPLMLGFTRYFPEREVVHNYYGAWYPNQGLSSKLYGKQIPVPFGEYIPFRSYVSALATEAAQVAVDMEGLANSSRYDVTLNDGRVVPLGLGICFEVGYESLWAQAVKDGAQILLTPSNNYHFRTTPEPLQQAQMARFRALEFGRSIVQVSTTGESVLARPDGGVLASTQRHQADTVSGELPLRTSQTWAAVMSHPLAVCVMYAWSALTILGLLRAGKYYVRNGS